MAVTLRRILFSTHEDQGMPFALVNDPFDSATEFWPSSDPFVRHPAALIELSRVRVSPQVVA